MKNYKKPQKISSNSPQGSYAAGCPEKGTGCGPYPGTCKNCERAR